MMRIFQVVALIASSLGCFAQTQQERNLLNETSVQLEEGPELQNTTYSVERPNSKLFSLDEVTTEAILTTTNLEEFYTTEEYEEVTDMDDLQGRILIEEPEETTTESEINLTTEDQGILSTTTPPSIVYGLPVIDLKKITETNETLNTTGSRSDVKSFLRKNQVAKKDQGNDSNVSQDVSTEKQAGGQGLFTGNPVGGQGQFDGNPVGEQGQFDGVVGGQGQYDGTVGGQGQFDGVVGGQGQFDGAIGGQGQFDGNPVGGQGQFDGAVGGQGLFNGNPVGGQGQFDGAVGGQGQFGGAIGGQGLFNGNPVGGQGQFDVTVGGQGQFDGPVGGQVLLNGNPIDGQGQLNGKVGGQGQFVQNAVIPIRQAPIFSPNDLPTSRFQGFQSPMVRPSNHQSFPSTYSSPGLQPQPSNPSDSIFAQPQEYFPPSEDSTKFTNNFIEDPMDNQNPLFSQPSYYTSYNTYDSAYEKPLPEYRYVARFPPRHQNSFLNDHRNGGPDSQYLLPNYRN